MEEMFENMYDNYNAIYSQLESMMVSLYDDLQKEPMNVDKSNMLQGLGSIALNVISSQMELVERYCVPQYKDNLLSNLDSRAIGLKDALNENKNRSR